MNHFITQFFHSLKYNVDMLWRHANLDQTEKKLRIVFRGFVTVKKRTLLSMNLTWGDKSNTYIVLFFVLRKDKYVESSRESCIYHTPGWCGGDWASTLQNWLLQDGAAVLDTRKPAHYIRSIPRTLLFPLSFYSLPFYLFSIRFYSSSYSFPLPNFLPRTRCCISQGKPSPQNNQCFSFSLH